jgi:hypothetical protein
MRWPGAAVGHATDIWKLIQQEVDDRLENSRSIGTGKKQPPFFEVAAFTKANAQYV